MFNLTALYEKNIIVLMIFLNKEREEMINEKYTQLYLSRQFGGINTIEFTQTLPPIKENE